LYNLYGWQRLEELGAVVQGAPIKNNPLKKFIISVTIEEFFTEFTALTEKDSDYIRSKFCYNIGCGLKITTILKLKNTFF